MPQNKSIKLPLEQSYKAKQGEILTEETVLHRLLHSRIKCDTKENTSIEKRIRHLRCLWRKDKLTANIKEKLLADNGFTKLETSKWTLL